MHEQEQKVRDQEEIIRTEENQIRQQEQQANLSADQQAQLEKRLDQLRARQNELRAKQDQLSEQEPNPFSRRSQQLSPFTRVQYEGDKVIVTYRDADYQLTAINDIPVPQMLAFCQANYKENWQKRFAEDLVVVMAQMGHPINGDKAKLSLLDPTTGKAITVDNAELTKQNRQSVSLALRRDGIVKPAN